MKDIAVSLRDVKKTYDIYENDRDMFRSIFSDHVRSRKVSAVDGVTFTVRKGEAVALLGKNGSGKSTLLKMIAGVTFQDEGEIEVNGRVSALLELTAGFDPDLTGRENTVFRAKLLGYDKERTDRLVRDVDKFAELGRYMDQPIKTYSSGMKARLGFALNVSMDSDIVIVDEALSVGDIAFRVKCLARIRYLIEHGVTFICVTHSAEICEEFCDRGIVLRNGKVKYDGDIKKAMEWYDEMLLNSLTPKITV